MADRNTIKQRPIRGLSVQAALDALYESVRELQNVPFLRQAWHWNRAIALTSGANTVNHGLGRTPIGFVVTDAKSVQYVHRTGDFTATSVQLTVGATGTADILFF